MGGTFKSPAGKGDQKGMGFACSCAASGTAGGGGAGGFDPDFEAIMFQVKPRGLVSIATAAKCFKGAATKDSPTQLGGYIRLTVCISTVLVMV